MALKLKFAHICETAFFSNRGNLNIINIFNTIRKIKPGKKSVVRAFDFVAEYEGGPGEYIQEIKIVDKNGKIIKDGIKGKIKIDAGKKRGGIIFSFGGITLKDGENKIIINIPEQKIKEEFIINVQ